MTTLRITQTAEALNRFRIEVALEGEGVPPQSASFGELDQAENQLGSEVFATPTICAGQIFMRVADRTSAGRVETLYCIGAE